MGTKQRLEIGADLLTAIERNGARTADAGLGETSNAVLSTASSVSSSATYLPTPEFLPKRGGPDPLSAILSLAAQNQWSPNRSSAAPRGKNEAPLSAIGCLLNEISWEGNARKYRHGGPGLENVLTVEVFQALDFLPRTEFLGRIIRSAVGGSPNKLKLIADQVEDLRFSLLPGDINLAEGPPRGKGRLHLQPDGILESQFVYCMLEAKRIKPGAFLPEQLAREFLAVLQEAGDRSSLLLLVLPAPPPVSVRGHGRLALQEAVAHWLPRVLERVESEFPVNELCSKIDSILAYTTWQRVYEEVEGALQKFSSADPSVLASISRLAKAVQDAISRHT